MGQEWQQTTEWVGALFLQECTMPAKASSAQRMSQVAILQVQTGPSKHLWQLRPQLHTWRPLQPFHPWDLWSVTVQIHVKPNPVNSQETLHKDVHILGAIKSTGWGEGEKKKIKGITFRGMWMWKRRLPYLTKESTTAAANTNSNASRHKPSWHPTLCQYEPYFAHCCWQAVTSLPIPFNPSNEILHPLTLIRYWHYPN